MNHICENIFLIQTLIVLLLHLLNHKNINQNSYFYSLVASNCLPNKGCWSDLGGADFTNIENVTPHNIRQRFLHTAKNMDLSFIIQQPDSPVTKMVQLLQEKEVNWKNLTTIADELSQDNDSSQLLDVLLTQAIQRDAGNKVIEQLISKGAKPSEGLIFILAIKGNVYITSLLIEHGLDIHYSNKHGKNALDHSVEHFNSREMFDFLLAKNVAFNKPRDQLESLDYLLNKIGNIDYATELYYIERLINHGAVVRQRHKKKIHSIEQQYPKYFQAISLLMTLE